MAAGGGHMKTVTWAISAGFKKNKKTCNSVAKQGNLAALKWLLENQFPYDYRILFYAASGNSIEVLEYVTGIINWGDKLDLFEFATHSVEILEWLWKRKPKTYEPGESRACLVAAEKGHLEGLDWCYQKMFHLGSWGKAVQNGHLHIVQWFKDNLLDWKNKLFADAAKGGHWAIAHWGLNNGATWNKETCTIAIEHGHFDFVKTALELGLPMHCGVIKAAVRTGCQPFIQYLLESGDLHIGDACTAAAEKGHLELLKYFQKLGCSCTTKTFQATLLNSQWKILEYLEEIECPIGVNEPGWGRFCRALIESNKLDSLKWMHQNGLPIVFDSIDRDIYFVAAQKGHIDILNWAFETGIPIGRFSFNFYRYEVPPLSSLQWIYFHHFKFTGVRGPSVIVQNDIKLLRFLYNTGNFRWTQAAIGLALESKNQEIISFMRKTQDTCIIL